VEELMPRAYTCRACRKPGSVRKHPGCLKKLGRTADADKAQRAAERRAETLLAPKGWTLNLGTRGGEIQAFGIFASREEGMAEAQRQDQLVWRDPDTSYAGYTAQGVQGVWLLSPDTAPDRDRLYEKRKRRPNAPVEEPVEVSVDAC
jgi:hypothetical protein